jgi:hypothetical protein
MIRQTLRFFRRWRRPLVRPADAQSAKRRSVMNAETIAQPKLQHLRFGHSQSRRHGRLASKVLGMRANYRSPEGENGGQASGRPQALPVLLASRLSATTKSIIA